MRWACRCCSVACPRRRTALMRTVKSRGPDTPTLVSALMRKHHAHTVAKKPGAPGRTRSSRSNHPRGECRDVSAEPVVPAACTFFRRRAMGAASARHSPCPLLQEGRSNGKARTRSAPREGELMSQHHHCEAPKQSRVTHAILDCFRRRPAGYGGHVAALAMTIARAFEPLPARGGTARRGER